MNTPNSDSPTMARGPFDDLPPALRLTLMREAWERTAVELLGSQEAAEATNRMADRMVSP